MCDTFTVLFISVIYFPLIPALFFICFANIALQFFIVKYWILYHHSIPKQLNAGVVINFAKKLPWCVWASSVMLLIITMTEHAKAVSLLT